MPEPKPKLTKPISKPNFKACLCVIVTSIKACLIGILDMRRRVSRLKTIRDQSRTDLEAFRGKLLEFVDIRSTGSSRELSPRRWGSFPFCA